MGRLEIFTLKQIIFFLFAVVFLQSSIFSQTFTWNSFVAGTLAPSTYSTSSGSCNMTASITGTEFSGSTGTLATNSGLLYTSAQSGGSGLLLRNNWANTTTAGDVVTITFSPAIVNPSFKIFDLNRSNPCGDLSSNQWVDRVVVQPNTGTVSATVNSAYQNISGNGTNVCTISAKLECNQTDATNEVTYSITGTVSTLTITYSSGTDVSRANAFVSCAIPTPSSCLTSRTAVTNPTTQFIVIGSISGQTVSAPSAITGGSTSICAGSSVTLTATGGNANTRWYTGSCGGTQIGTGASISVSPSSSTTYFAANVNCGTITSCAQVTVNVVNPPSITATTPAARCGSGSLVLGATSSSGTISWFTNSSGGTSFHTGTSYTTPVLTSSTTYYVEASSGSCISASRTPVTATINSPSSSGLTSGEWLWTGATSISWQEPSNWLVFSNPVIYTQNSDFSVAPSGWAYTGITPQTTLDGTLASAGFAAAGNVITIALNGSSTQSVTYLLRSNNSSNARTMLVEYYDGSSWVTLRTHTQATVPLSTTSYTDLIPSTAQILRFNMTVRVGSRFDLDNVQIFVTNYSVPANPPAYTDNVRIRQNGTCILNQPTIDGVSTAVGPTPNTIASSSNDCQNIVIESGAIVTFQNGFNRHLHVAGNYQNFGTMNYNDGRIKFIKNGTQTVFDHSGTAVFYEVNIGGNSITDLLSHLQITNALRLNGVIQTNANRTYLNNIASASLVNFGGHIFGNFRRDISTNTDVYKFPMGVSTSLAVHPSGGRRLLEFLNNNITGVSYLDCSVSNTFKSGGVQNDPSLDPAKAIQAGQIMDFVHPEAQWRLTPNSSVTSGNYGVRLYVQNFTSLDASKDNKFIVLKRQDNSLSFFDFNSFESSTVIPAPSTAGRIFDNALGYAERTGFSTFSEFVIASNPTPLPVKLNDFNVKCNNTDNVITWSTLNERNNDYFTIEYSPSASDFSPIAYVVGSLQSNSLLTYSINHTPLFVGNHYYRLYQTDLDGSKEFLAEQVVNNTSCAEKNDLVSIFQNGENIQLQFNVQEKSNVKFDLYDGIGKLIFSSGSTYVNQTENIQFIPINNLASGVYFIQVELNGTYISYKVSL